MIAIIVNGSAGTGKSTLLDALSNADIQDCALLDGDDVGRIVPFELCDRYLDVIRENIVSCAVNFAKHGYEVLVIGFVFPSEQRLNMLKDELAKYDISSIVCNLYCDNTILRQRIIERNTSRLISCDSAVNINNAINSLPSDCTINTTELNSAKLSEVFIKIVQQIKGEQ